MAEESIRYAKEDLEKQIEQKEKSYDELVAELAEQLINENEQYLSKDLANEAKEQVKKRNRTKTRKEEGK